MTWTKKSKLGAFWSFSSGKVKSVEAPGFSRGRLDVERAKWLSAKVMWNPNELNLFLLTRMLYS